MSNFSVLFGVAGDRKHGHQPLDRCARPRVRRGGEIASFEDVLDQWLDLEAALAKDGGHLFGACIGGRQADEVPIQARRDEARTRGMITQRVDGVIGVPVAPHSQELHRSVVRRLGVERHLE